VKAAFFEGPGKVVIREIPTPECPPGGLLTRVRVSAICGSDRRTFEYGSKDPSIVHGHECVMGVIETDDGTGRFTVGDRILVAPVGCGQCYYCRRGLEHLCSRKEEVRTVKQGGFAEFRPVGREAIEGGYVMKVPDEITDAEATLVEPLACVLNGNEKLAIYPGDSFVALGAGPVGNLHVQMARLRGASTIVVVDVKDSRLELNKPFGAAHLVNSSRVDPIAEVMKVTGDEGADRVVVACVSARAEAQAVAMARKQGEVLLFSALPDTAPEAVLNTNLIHIKELYVMGARSATRRHFALALQLLRTGRIDARRLVTHTLPLDQIALGFEIIKEGRGLKVVLEP